MIEDDCPFFLAEAAIANFEAWTNKRILFLFEYNFSALQQMLLLDRPPLPSFLGPPIFCSNFRRRRRMEEAERGRRKSSFLSRLLFHLLPPPPVVYPLPRDISIAQKGLRQGGGSGNKVKEGFG